MRMGLADASKRRHRVRIHLAGIVVVALIVPFAALPASASDHTGSPSTLSDVAHRATVPNSPVGNQLTWLLEAGSQLPLSNAQESAHFDATFIAAEPVTKLNEALASLGSTGSTVLLVGLSSVTASSLTAEVQIGLITYDVQLAVDSKGLIDGLFFSLAKPIPIPKVSSWTQLDKDLKVMAPESSFVAAKLGSDGTCTDEHVLDATTPRPLGSMFKLFILGALANAVKSHRVTWDQKLTVTANIKVGGSGVLQSDPDGTTLTVEQTAVTMISESDNTAADMLLQLVGRSAVEAEVRSWSLHASLDTPFLSAAEFFVLKWDDFPLLANRYLSLSSGKRLAYLTSTIDEISASRVVATVLPRDINSIEWFSSPDDMCRAFAGLRTLESQPGLGQLSTILSTNNGGIELNAATWPLVWFKGGSEPGVLTLGYLARDSSGSTFVVVMMLENTKKAIAPSSTLLGLGVVTGALNLLREGKD